jgi:hypothetical protein
MLLFACLATCGCQWGGRHKTQLERESRVLEDRNNYLLAQLDQAQDDLKCLREENEMLQRGLTEAGSDYGGPRSRTRSDDRRRERDRDSEIPDEPPVLKVTVPDQSEFRSETPDAFRAPGGEASQEKSEEGSSFERGAPPRGGEGSDATPPGNEDREKSEEPGLLPGFPSAPSGPELSLRTSSEGVVGIDVGELFLEKITGLTDAPNEEGFSLVVRPRDKSGRPLPAAAPISVAVIDPAVPDESARVARWDFEPWETASVYEPTPDGPGFRLRLRWPENRPKHKELHLFVRYTTADGRRVQAEAPLDLGRLAIAEPPGGGWQRKVAPEPRHEPEPPREIARFRERPRPVVDEAPAWNQASDDRRTSTDSNTAVRRSEEPKQVAKRLKRPVWSPDRE